MPHVYHRYATVDGPRSYRRESGAHAATAGSGHL